jgi:hypothetical protein
MAEYDNAQLHSNYQSYHNNDYNGSASIHCKRKKINNHYDNETIRALKCQRPNENYNNNNYQSNIIQSTSKSTTTSITPSNDTNKNNNYKSCTIFQVVKNCIDNYNNDNVTNNNNNNNKNNSFMHNQLLNFSHNNYDKCNNTKNVHRMSDAMSNSSSLFSFSCYKSKNSFTLALLIIIGLMFKINPCCGFVLDGTQNSHAQFRKWYTGLNGTLELEFKTEQPNGLVLYTDDGGTYDFFELKLVEGALRLRYNLGGGAQIITVGRDLHDGHWHKVQVKIILILFFSHIKLLNETNEENVTNHATTKLRKKWQLTHTTVDCTSIIQDHYKNVLKLYN